jgi:hypothetical protein
MLNICKEEKGSGAQTRFYSLFFFAVLKYNLPLEILLFATGRDGEEPRL